MSLNHLKFFFTRISTRFALLFSGVLIFCSLIMFGLLYLKLKDSLESQELMHLDSKLHEFQYQAEFGISPSLIPESEFQGFLFSATGDVIRIWLSDDKQINLNPYDVKRDIFESELGHARLPIKLGGDQAFYLRKKNLSNGQVLIVLKISTAVEQQLSNIRALYYWLFLPGLVICSLGGLLLARKTLSPIREVIATMRKVEKGSLSARVPVGPGSDELSELKCLLNRMLDKTEGLVNGLKEAFDHLAHDIRTPVTRLRGRVELALNKESDLNIYKEALQSCFENTDKILNFLQVLSDITEAENRSKKLKLEKSNVSDLVHEMMDLYEMVFEEKQIQVSQSFAKNDWAFVDKKLLSRVIANLLDNAHKYTPAGGSVSIETINDIESVVLRISDTGPGISFEEQTLIWQKLYRCDKSRSEHGMGLGLTFVKAVVEAHGGEVRVQSPSIYGQGSHFEICLQKMS